MINNGLKNVYPIKNQTTVIKKKNCGSYDLKRKEFSFKIKIKLHTVKKLFFTIYLTKYINTYQKMFAHLYYYHV